MEVRQILPRQLVIGELLARQSRKNPSSVAFVDGDLQLTYRELDQRVNRLAGAIGQRGVVKGDKVGLLMFNCMQMVESYFALAKLGAVAVPINFRLAGAEVAYIVNNSETRMLIYDDMFQKMIEGIKAQIPAVKDLVTLGEAPQTEILSYEKFLQCGRDEEPMTPVFDDDPAYIMYTSGTTGRAKGAVITHKNKLMCCINGLIETSLSESDVYLCVPPIFHTAALFAVMMFTYLGAKTILVKQFNPVDVVETVAREGITAIFLVPAMWNMVLQVPGVAEKMSGLRIGITGASIMPVQLKMAILKTLPRLAMIDALGQTEMSPVTTLLKPEHFLRKTDSVGRPAVSVEIRVVDSMGKDVPQGQVGEIIYSGPTMMKEYYRNPKATAEAIKDGWFYSGDMVRVDEEGYIYVVDRKVDMIITGGENVYSAEVEEVLYRHEKVLEAAVIGVPDEKWGERVHAVVVCKPGISLTAEEIIDWCALHLAGYKKPRFVDFVDALPRNASGKVLKIILRKSYGEKGSQANLLNYEA